MINPNENVVVIIGHPDTGKTHLSEELAAQYPEHKIYHTDDYIKWGYEDALYKMMSDIEYDRPEKFIVEGVQGYRLLRKWAQEGKPGADLVIITERMPRPDQARASEYMGVSLQTVWRDYAQQVGKLPRIIKYR
jgi:hypothetical protein